MRLKLSIVCFSLRTNYFCIIESIDAFSFVNGVIAYKAFLVKEKGNKVVYKIFIANVVSMHLSATNSGLFKGHGLGYPGGLLLRGGGSPNRGKSPGVWGWGVQKCEGTMYQDNE